MRNYRAILLAAGFGKRLKPLTDIWPKCLMPIQGKPLLDLWISNLQTVGIKDILVNTHYMADTVKEFLSREKFKDLVTFSYEEQILGTAGAIKANRKFFKNSPVLVAHADNLCSCDFAGFISHHELHHLEGYPISMMSFQCNNPSSCGVIEVDELGIVRRMHEKIANPPGKLANGAVYIFEPKIIEWISKSDNLSDISTEVLPEFFGRILNWENNQIHIDIGRLEDLKAAQKFEMCDRNIPTQTPDAWEINFAKHEIHHLIKKNNEKVS